MFDICWILYAPVTYAPLWQQSLSPETNHSSSSVDTTTLQERTLFVCCLLIVSDTLFLMETIISYKKINSFYTPLFYQFSWKNWKNWSRAINFLPYCFTVACYALLADRLEADVLAKTQHEEEMSRSQWPSSAARPLPSFSCRLISSLVTLQHCFKFLTHQPTHPDLQL